MQGRPDLVELSLVSSPQPQVLKVVKARREPIQVRRGCLSPLLVLTSPVWCPGLWYFEALPLLFF